MNNRLHVLFASQLLLLATSACSSDNDDTPATQADYDDVAQALGASVAAGANGGDVASISDSVDLSIGVPPVGIDLSASGAFNGSRAGLEYSYELDCKDDAGRSLTRCDTETATADVRVSWSGDLVLPHVSAAVDRQGQWTLTRVQSGTVELTGSSTFEFDAQLQLPRLNVSREYHLSYVADYTSVRVQRSPLAISGEVHYTVNAVRKASSDRGDREARFEMDADLTFNTDRTATLILDGNHQYTVNLALAVTVRR